MSELYFGYSDCIITPHANIGLAGYEKRNNHGFGNSGVMDDLYARALSLKSENDELILITLDLCLINENTGDEIRSRVAQKLKIPVENVMLCVSHTHSGPRTWSPNDDTGSETTQIINSYMDDVTNKIVSICSQASSISFKGQIYTATFSASLGYNRRYVVEDKDSNDNDDKVKMLFNLWKNPEHNTNGIIDTDIPVLLIERIDEKKLYDSYFGQAGLDRIVLFNVPIHPVVMGEDSRYVSADYPGAARRCIENTLGYGTKAMFLLGACGNVNPLLACQYNPKAIEVLGNAIGYGICAALSRRKKAEFDKLKIVVENIKLNDEAKASRIVTQIFKIGNTAITAVSCECFTELGINIRKKSNFQQTLVASNSNGGYGYIPTREALINQGGYEVNSAKRMGYDEDLLKRVEDTVVKNLNQLE